MYEVIEITKTTERCCNDEGNLQMCYLVLDEADRMVNTDGFHDDIINLLSHPSCPPKDSRNTVMFRCDSHKIIGEL